ncbi:MAG: TlpA family protein disulfide reductase [Oceanihabitans sp.]
MKKFLHIFLISLLIVSCTAQEAPTKFTEAALNDTFVSTNNQNILFKEILEKHKGKTILIDVWASWCGDCIKGLPKVKALQNNNKEVVFVFLSADRSISKWKNGINKHQVKGDHYFMPKGMKSVFSKSIGLNWIPRYMLVDPEGGIKLYKAIKADNKQLLNALN